TGQSDQSLALVVPHVLVPVSQGFYADQSLALVDPHVVVPVWHGLYADQFSGLGCPVRLGFYSRTGQALAMVVPVSLGFIPELDNHWPWLSLSAWGRMHNHYVRVFK
ncbi:hypothetical protein ACJMK2_015034, partial [Sinanodonta woodiana]